MSLFWKQSARGLGDSSGELIPGRSSAGRNRPTVNQSSALRHSGFWAGLRLRADLLSQMPVDLFRVVDGVQVEVTKPAVLIRPGALFPGGPLAAIDEWLWASQFDLDRYGNSFGLIIERDARSRPSRIDLVNAGDVTVVQRDGKITYRIGGKTYLPNDVWHEKQYVVAGLPVGLSPVAQAALTLGEYLSAQEFALAWFGGTAVPSGTLKNTKKTLTPSEAADAKLKFRESIQAGDIFVTGSDWEYTMATVPQATTQFIEAQQWSIAEAARFVGVPGDLIDAPVQGSAITYANISQRVVQLLVMNLSAPVLRRERALTELTPTPQFVKLNTNVLLRLDPQTQATVVGQKVKDRVMTNAEARGLDNRQPLTAAEIAEFHDIYGNPNKTPTTGSAT